MPIRARVAQTPNQVTLPKPQYRDGYPNPWFEGYTPWFGSIAAVFTTAKWQALAGFADTKILRAPKGDCATLYYTREALQHAVYTRGHGTEWMEFALEHWPEGKIPYRLHWPLTREA